MVLCSFSTAAIAFDDIRTSIRLKRKEQFTIAGKRKTIMDRLKYFLQELKDCVMERRPVGWLGRGRISICDPITATRVGANAIHSCTFWLGFKAFISLVLNTIQLYMIASHPVFIRALCKTFSNILKYFKNILKIFSNIFIFSNFPYVLSIRSAILWKWKPSGNLMET